MAVDKSKLIPVGGALHSIATGNTLVYADEITDEQLGRKQSEVNQSLTQSIDINNTATNKKIADLQSDYNTHKTNKSNPHEVTKAQVGLGNVTNDAQVKRTEIGQASGVASLDAKGSVPLSQLSNASATYATKAAAMKGIGVDLKNNSVTIRSMSITDVQLDSDTIPAATSDTAGVMAATDKKNLDRLVSDTYPFSIGGISNTSGGTLEKGTTKTFDISWWYRNTDYNPIKSQVLSGGSLSASVTVANDTTKYTVSNLTDTTKDSAKTFAYKLTAMGGSTTKDATTYVTFVHRSYAGVVAASKTSLTATDVKGLTNQSVQNSKSRTVSISQNNQKIAYCYPAYLGNLTSIKDGNGFQGFSGYTKSIVDVDGVTYNVYLQNTQAISSGTYTFA